ncbi:MAG TPA: glycosyltransferase family 2 protein [Chitinophagaceae bacterium]|nr:glycosyltransferase family 2 protein [Chitinophagaceae bacterium]
MNESSPSLQNHRQPLVSIGLPTYNRPAGLQKVLDCIHAQTYSNLEIIISDNCSDNAEVAAIIRAAGEKDKRIRAITQATNIGLEGNFNFVYARATGDYFIWMSDDDVFDDNYIAECVKYLEGHKDHVLCSGQSIYYTNGEYTFTEDMMPVIGESPFGRASKFFDRMQQNGKFYGVFRNKLLAAEPLGHHIGCDWSFMAKLAILGKLNFTTTTNYHRAIGGNSVNRKRLVSRYGYKGFKKVFLETYSAYIISLNLFKDPAIKGKFGFAKRVWLQWIVFVKIHWLHLTNSIRTRVRRRKS